MTLDDCLGRDPNLKELSVAGGGGGVGQGEVPPVAASWQTRHSRVVQKMTPQSPMMRLPLLSGVLQVPLRPPSTSLAMLAMLAIPFVAVVHCHNPCPARVEGHPPNKLGCARPFHVVLHRLTGHLQRLCAVLIGPEDADAASGPTDASHTCPLLGKFLQSEPAQAVVLRFVRGSRDPAIAVQYLDMDFAGGGDAAPTAATGADRGDDGDDGAGADDDDDEDGGGGRGGGTSDAITGLCHHLPACLPGRFTTCSSPPHHHPDRSAVSPEKRFCITLQVQSVVTVSGAAVVAVKRTRGPLEAGVTMASQLQAMAMGRDAAAGLGVADAARQSPRKRRDSRAGGPSGSPTAIFEELYGYVHHTFVPIVRSFAGQHMRQHQALASAEATTGMSQALASRSRSFTPLALSLSLALALTPLPTGPIASCVSLQAALADVRKHLAHLELSLVKFRHDVEIPEVLLACPVEVKTAAAKVCILCGYATCLFPPT